MFPLRLVALVLLSSAQVQVHATHYSTIPEDVHAFPKYRIQFLNGRPLLNATAQRWLQEGGTTEQEFLGLHKSYTSSDPSFKGIGSVPQDELATAATAAASPSSPVLQQMRLGATEYLCLILPPPEVPNSSEDTEQAPQAMHTWELLQPLEGTCLYVSETFLIGKVSVIGRISPTFLVSSQHRQGTLFFFSLLYSLIKLRQKDSYTQKAGSVMRIVMDSTFGSFAKRSPKCH